MPVFPGCHGLSRHLSDEVKRLFRFATAYPNTEIPYVIVVLLAQHTIQGGLRRVRDSNPRGVAACLVSGEVHSSSLPTLQTAAGLTDGGGSGKFANWPAIVSCQGLAPCGTR